MTWSSALDWKVELTDSAQKRLASLDKTQVYQLTKYLRRVSAMEDPKGAGKVLVGNLHVYWRYRVGDYRVICEFRDIEMVIVVVEFKHT